jgi:hypothetical protein
VAVGSAISRRTLDNISEFWPNATLAGKADQLFWRAKNRYVALRGDASAGKSTALNLLLGAATLSASKGQTTACVTEVRLVGHQDGVVEPRVHLASERLLAERLRQLSRIASQAEYADYVAAARAARQRIVASGVELGSAVTATHWHELGFSLNLGQAGRHNLLVDRIIYPVPIDAPHPLDWALAGEVSFLDLPGDARGEVFNAVILEETQRSYAPAVTLRLWSALSNDRPDLRPDEILVVTFLDDPEVVPGSNYMKAIHGTVQAYGRVPLVLSVAAEAPPELALVPLTAAQGLQHLRDWDDWLGQSEQAPDRVHGWLRDAVRRTLEDPRGGKGALLDAVRSRLELVPRPTLADADVKELAEAVRDEALRLLDQLVEPKSRRELGRQRKIEQQQSRQARRQHLAELAQARVYGPYGSEPWQSLADLLYEPSTDRPVDVLALLREHATAAEQACYADAGIAAGPLRLATVAAPLFRELHRMLSAPGSRGDPATWVDVARVRWELCGLLTDLAVAADDTAAATARGTGAGAAAGDGVAETGAAPVTWPEYTRRAGALRECLDWVESYL